MFDFRSRDVETRDTGMGLLSSAGGKYMLVDHTKRVHTVLQTSIDSDRVILRMRTRNSSCDRGTVSLTGADAVFRTACRALTDPSS